MFTGLIEEIGILRRAVKRGEAMVLTIEASRIMEGIALGDSIAVNGVCLTVTNYDSKWFTADVMPETYRKSDLHRLASGQRVNLERAMMAGGRFGGHIVQGHIDGTGSILSRKTDANAVVFTVEVKDEEMLRFVIPKGSITIDGISLTVVDTKAEQLSVSIIPHTLAQTALQYKQPGDTVNLECDVIGKYVDHLLHYTRASDSKPQAKSSPLSAAFLTEHGFL
ncbi:riboflavin synthase [Paenibacillus sp. GCM10023252]|uniref:riboflavin synthase n=1 Tax=Paenibacillus sp. GCM10023252 TaxID=3252649 RepID=UPI003610ABBC